MMPMIDRVKTGEKIKEHMTKKGLTATDIQGYLSLGCVQSVYRWFYGISMPTIDNLYALSILFDVPIDDLIVGDPVRNRNDGDPRMSMEPIIIPIERINSRNRAQAADARIRSYYKLLTA